MTDKPKSETTAGLSVGEVLPVFEHCPCGTIGRWVSPDLQPNAVLDVIAAQAAEIERLKRDLDGAREAHLRYALDESIPLAALKAKQVADIDEVMRLAEDMMRASWAIGNEGPEYNAAREALRSALAARGME